ncbi:unnamed protein product [Caenorhabditis angaria]|uniref:C-type lectin domain-containing protein n=1 Tax=Caenorhabditis angaria TaxID=860376 RepID=A0A9P1J012_9PELO|nr:unnamed protein product [Caenorhabditis angaria]
MLFNFIFFAVLVSSTTAQNLYKYISFSNPLSESDAEAVCQQQCGHLASIHSYNENSNVADFSFPSSYNYFRIGLKYQNNTNVWTDGTDFDYSNIGYQNSNFGNCYSFSIKSDVVAAGKWISSRCDTPLPFVCKVPIGACVTTPTPTITPSQCSGPQFAENDAYFFSPNYPITYAGDSQDCTYIFSTPKNTIASISFNEFQLDDYSTIELFNEIEDPSPVRTFDSSNTANGLYNSTSNTMKIVFRSFLVPDKKTYRWVAHLQTTNYSPNVSTTAVPTTTKLLSSTTTAMVSACGPSRYFVPNTDIFYPYMNGIHPVNQFCTYSVSTSFGNRIALNVSYIFMEQDSHLIVYDGASTTASEILFLKGPGTFQNVPEVRSSSSHMLLFFNTYSVYDNFSSRVTSI